MQPPTVDLRLVPAALSVWAAAGVGVGVPVGVSLAGSAVLACAALLVGVHARRRVGPRKPSGGRRRGGRAGPVARHRGVGAVVSGLVLALAAASLCLGVVALDVHARESGTLGRLVRAAATVEVMGVVRGEPAALAPRPGRQGSPGARLVVEVREVAGRGEVAAARAPVLLLGPRSWLDVDLGARVHAVGRLAPTDRGDDVVALLIVSDDPEVVGAPSSVSRAVNAIRAGLLVATERLPPDAAGLVPGIAVGDTSRVPADLEAAMRAVSLTHVTAVSGAHVAIILGVVLGLTGWLRAVPRAVLAVGALTGFVVLVHPEPSVLRAAAMGAVTILGLLLGRPSRAVPALAAAVMVLVLLDPWITRAFGFVLSVLATAGIVVIAPAWAARWSGRLPRGAAYALAVPAAAQAMCAPVVVLLQPALAVYAVPANILAAPAVPPATVLGVIATVTAVCWPSGAEVFAHGAGAFAWWIAFVARRFADLPGAQLPWPGGLGGAVLLAATTVVVATAAARAPWRRRSVRTVAVVVALALAVSLAPGARRVVGGFLPDAWPPRGWAMVMCDVGQGTALVVRSGPTSGVMVDVGPDDATAAYCLDALGVDRLDLLVLSHLHEDHVGGLAEVLAGRRVAAALVSPYGRPSTARERVSALLRGAGVPVAAPIAPDPADLAGYRSDYGATAWHSGEVRWAVVWPTGRALRSTSGEGGTPVNDMSLALLLERRDLRVISLGDMETTAQAALARTVRRARAGLLGRTESAKDAALRGVDVVVVAHHGSARQDLGLARLLSADVALVSVGEGNDYGHPSRRTLDLYASAGARVLRTDRCGAIAVLVRPLATVERCPADDTDAGGREDAGVRQDHGVSAVRGTLCACRLPPRPLAHVVPSHRSPGMRSRSRRSCSSRARRLFSLIVRWHGFRNSRAMRIRRWRSPSSRAPPTSRGDSRR